VAGNANSSTGITMIRKCKKFVKNDTYIPLNSFMHLRVLLLSHYSNFTFKDVGIGAEEDKLTKNLLISPFFFY
jgi:hypothetical protein